MREGLVQAGVRIYPADRLAEDALRGLERDKAVLVIPREWYRNWVPATDASSPRLHPAGSCHP